MSSLIPDAIETAFYDRTKAGREHVAAGGDVCGYYHTGMPVEIALATGHMPMAIQPLPDRPTPLADEWVNPTFNPEWRLILDQLLSDELTFLRVVVAVSKAQADSWVYYSAREILRQEVKNNIPPLHNYALLGMREPTVKKYGRLELDALERRLAANSLNDATDESLRAAIETMNTIRAAWRQLDQARRAGRLSGCDAIKLLSASHFMHPNDYISAINQALGRLPMEGDNKPRIAVISSTGLGDMLLHEAIEKGGATVVAEGDWWGSASITPDIVAGDDPMQAIYEHYYEYVPNLCMIPDTERLKWFYQNAADPGIDAFVIHMPKSDRALGWDYPRMRDCLYDNNKPHLMTRDDSSNPTEAEAITKQVAGLVESLRENVA